MLLKKLLTHDESPSIEFKSYWYWGSNDSRKLQKGWGELQKDLVALLNTKTQENFKYLIAGFDEKTKKYNDFHVDAGGNEIDELRDPESFLEDLISKLRRNFRAKFKDTYRDLNLLDLKNYIEFDIQEIDGYKLLIVKVSKTPFVLELTKVLPANEAYKAGNILIRKLRKNSNDPENVVANAEDMEELIAQCKNSNEISTSERKYTVSKLVECFKSVQSPKSIVVDLNEDNANKYEHYSLTGGVLDYPIHIVYFNKYTVQTRAVSSISHSNSIDKKSKVYLVTDNKNRAGNNFNESKIKNEFLEVGIKAQVYTIEQFSLKHIYDNAFNSDILHDGDFSISDYITPKTTGSDKDADVLISEWIDIEDSPLMTIKGIGGIGKTTVVKHYLDQVYKRYKEVNIIFISSHEIINTLSKNEEINDIYDFYKAFISEEDSELEYLDKRIFELTIDHGNLIFVIDGIDEVLAKLGNKFDINRLISSIFSEYTSTLAKAKVILTCREEFWSAGDFEDKIYSLTLSPFTKELATEYFNRKFDNHQSKVKKALKLAEQFALDKETNQYIPYILDMVKENLLEESCEGVPNSSFIVEKLTNDYLIGKVCDREVFKLGHNDIDEQIKFFINLSVVYEGEAVIDGFVKNETISQKQADIYKAHPLLSYDGDRLISFRYDFFLEYFKTIYVYKLLLDDIEFHNLNESDKRILTQVLSIGLPSVTNILERVDNTESMASKLKEALFLFVADEANSSYVDKKLSSAILYFIFCIYPDKDKSEKMNVVNELYGMDGVIKNLSLINFYSSKLLKVVFDFSGYELQRSYIENYPDFSRCTFDDNTIFKSTVLKKPLCSESKVNFRRKHFSSCCDTNDIEHILEELEDSELGEEQVLEKGIKKCLTHFWSNGKFRTKTADFINRKMNKSHDILTKLVAVGVVVETKKTTSDKRMEKCFEIAKEFRNDLSKIMEQNSTNSVFRSVLNDIKSL
ncbi:NACHT domain-containing protein [Vibrio sp. 2CM40D]|uniref:NACHT domain-containing protein n=1 Tax=Vibrio sp. 2CM40D TaxID=2929855 RepID=UPI0020BD9C0B|nr:NACHT domain-containing protein [Vibrio sp. 2CM40D]MCK8110498.1 NACHT domain-containing protein [Vibrio sp. 2CM40D]